MSKELEHALDHLDFCASGQSRPFSKEIRIIRDALKGHYYTCDACGVRVEPCRWVCDSFAAEIADVEAENKAKGGAE